MNKIQNMTIQKPRGVDLLHQKIKHISHHAGVYRMLDEEGTVLYVGKAKDLKKRLTNYTRTDQLSQRIRQMVSKTADLIVIETAGETEALILENDLIKQFKPFYNILLKDDKGYPYVIITQEETPRIIKYYGSGTRPKGTMFGPYASRLAVKQTLIELQKIFGLRTCNNTYFSNRTRPCLLYQIKRCSAPCVGYITKEAYDEQVKQAKAFMRGEKTDIQEKMRLQMQALANAEEFEKAAVLRDKIIALNQIQDTDTQVLIKNTDIVAVYFKNNQACVQIFFYRSGKSEGNAGHMISPIDDQSLSEDLSSFLMQFYDRVPPPFQIYISHPVDDNLEAALSQKAGHTVHISDGPFKGARKKLLDQAINNAKQSFERTQSEQTVKKEDWEELRQLLGIPTLDKVEVYDNSHIQGTAAVGAMIAATVDGFFKKGYRRFNIDGSLAKTNDDFGMMKEVMKRRLTRGAMENDLPSAMLIDGGKGQLSAVLEIMNDLNIHDIALLAVAKGEDRNAGRETFFLGSDPKTPIHLDYKGRLIHLIQRLRDEAHRFAVGSHRIKRAQNMFRDTLSEIEGIGAKRKKALLTHFGSPRGIAGASLEQLQNVDGINEKIAKKIYTFYHD